MIACRLVCVGLALALGACGGMGKGASVPPPQQIDLSGAPAPASGAARQTASAERPAAGVGVNSYLWRASLDTLRFMPLAAADPFGGTIITDWFAPPQTPDERFKATVYILDKSLRADALRVSVFRQTRAKDGSWVDASVDPSTAGKVENAILTRARQLRLASGPK
jgi:hypothetical protein